MSDSLPAGWNEGPDLPALAWCATEIRQSLQQVCDAILLPAQGADWRMRIGQARDALAQATGAMRLADLRGFDPLIDEVLAVIDGVESGEASADPARQRAAVRACSALAAYLDDLLAGEPHQPLRLYPYFRDLLIARGADRIHPADLLAIGTGERCSTLEPSGSRTASDADTAALAAARGAFERGLLGVLRNAGDRVALDAIHGALMTARGCAANPGVSLLWDAAIACVEAWRDGDISLDVQGKRLLARFNLQLRQAIAQDAPVADRLFAETLFMLAQLRGASPVAQALREHYRLDDAIPDDLERFRYEVVDASVFSAIAQRVLAARDTWEAALDDPVGEVAADSCASLAHALARMPVDGAAMLAQRIREAVTAATGASGARADTIWLGLAGALLALARLFERGTRRVDAIEREFGRLARELERLRAGEPPGSAPSAMLAGGPEAGVAQVALEAFTSEARRCLQGVEETIQSASSAGAGLEWLDTAVRLLGELAAALRAIGQDAGSDEVSDLIGELGGLRDSLASAPLQPAVLDTLATRLGAIGLLVDSLASTAAVQSGLQRGALDLPRLVEAAMAGPEMGGPGLSEPVEQPAREPLGETTDARSIDEEFLAEADRLMGVLSEDAQSWLALPSRSPSVDARDAMRALDEGARRASLVTVSAIAAQLGAFLGNRLSTGAGAGPEDITDYCRVLERLQALLHQFAAGARPRDETAALALARQLAARGERGPAGDARQLMPVGVDGDPPVQAVDAGLLAAFLDEAGETLPRIGETLGRLAQEPQDASVVPLLKRWLHTIKGSARMVGAMALGERVHEMESRLELFGETGPLPPAVLAELAAAHDEVMNLFDRIRFPDRREAPEAGRGQVMLRVPADRLELMINQSGEAAIARSRLDNELSRMRQSLRDLAGNVVRLRSHLREIEREAGSAISNRAPVARAGQQLPAGFDALEFDRYSRLQQMSLMLAESVDDVATFQAAANGSLEQALQDLVRQGQVLRELQQNLMRMRMLRFGSIADRLQRLVRQAAAELGKSARLDLSGGAVEIDRGILEAMAAPIEHLLRNALAHGIEVPQARIALGKPAQGVIRVEVRQEGGEVGIVIADDGAGLDLPRIVEKARSQGLVEPGRSLTDREAIELIFAPGLSTASAVDAISGRGVGLDVVRSEVAALGGRIDTVSESGAGVRFTIRLPVTMAIAQVVLLEAGGSRVAVAASGVEQVLQLRAQAFAEACSAGCIDWEGERIALHDLGRIIEAGEPSAGVQALSAVVILRSANQRIAVHAKTVSPSQEVVVKKVGAQAGSVPGVSGATVLASGEIVMIVNLVRLAQAVLGDDWSQCRPIGSLDAAGSLPAAAPSIMVVDDSITVRKVTRRLLEREGYRVTLASDGVEAMRLLDEARPSLILSDLEMPRMDGFDLLRSLRGDDATRTIPVIVISSRNADKHRHQAALAGADLFIGKPWREDELLAHIARLLDPGRES
jgi:chemotaxis protein histidine kinase CheA/CheY-like chemotaxis protein